MTVKEAAARLEVCGDTVYALCEGHLLAHRRVGSGRGTIRIDEADLVAYLAQSRVEADGEPVAKPRRKPLVIHKSRPSGIGPWGMGSNMDIKAELAKRRAQDEAKEARPGKDPKPKKPAGPGKPKPDART